MTKNCFYDGERTRLRKKLGISENIAEVMASLAENLYDDEEENGEVQYEYIDLVYPPNSTPPTRNSIKKINLRDFNQIHKMIC